MFLAQLSYESFVPLRVYQLFHEGRKGVIGYYQASVKIKYLRQGVTEVKTR